MKRFTQILLVLWGLALIGGGVAGYVKANSLASLIAGCGFGVAMLVEAGLAFKMPRAAFFGAAGLSFILLCYFGKGFWDTQMREVRPGALAASALLVSIVAVIAAAISPRRS